MLKKLLTAMMLVSMLACLAVVVLWFRGNHGHTDSFGFPWIGVSYHFDTARDQVLVHTIHKQNEMIFDNAPLVPFKTILGYTLVLPAIWTAIKIRSLIPRPTRPPRDRISPRLPKL